MNVVTATEFKAKCLALIDEVRESGARFVISKHGRRVAELVRYVDLEETSAQESLRGTARILSDIETPVAPPDDWLSMGGK